MVGAAEDQLYVSIGGLGVYTPIGVVGAADQLYVSIGVVGAADQLYVSIGRGRAANSLVSIVESPKRLLNGFVGGRLPCSNLYFARALTWSW